MFAETATDGNKVEDALVKCGRIWHYDADAIRTCAKGAEGMQYNHLAVSKTPDHDFIPWEAVDGVKLTQTDRDSMHKDLFQWVCNHSDSKDGKSLCKKKFMSDMLMQMSVVMSA